MLKRVSLLSLALLLFITGAAVAQNEAKIKSEVEKNTTDFLEIRKHLHKHPELSNKEVETAKYISTRLKSLGLSVQEGVAGTGLVTVIQGKPGSRVVAVRADMDALPITESTGLPYASVNKGVMHACGHDVHMTVGLGAAIVLNSMKDQFEGQVKFIFQPAEEGMGGANVMVEEGALKNPDVDVIFGLHCLPGAPAGAVSYVSGGVMASADGFSITIKGKGTHASSPWQGIDPIVTAANVLTSLQNIRSRRTDTREALVITVGTINGGTRSNIISDEVHMTGTIRTHDQELREKIPGLMEQVIKGVCEANGAEYVFRHNYGIGVTNNDPPLTAWSVAQLKSVLGEENVTKAMPFMGAEDFSKFSDVVPGFFMFLGVTKENNPNSMYSLHNSNFAPDDSSVPAGVESMVNLVMKYLNSDVTFSLKK